MWAGVTASSTGVFCDMDVFRRILIARRLCESQNFLAVVVSTLAYENQSFPGEVFASLMNKGKHCKASKSTKVKQCCRPVQLTKRQ